MLYPDEEKPEDEHSLLGYDKRPWNFKPDGFEEEVKKLHMEKEMSLAEFSEFMDKAVPDKEQIFILSDRIHNYYVLRSLTQYLLPFCIAVWAGYQMYQGSFILVPISLATMSVWFVSKGCIKFTYEVVQNYHTNIGLILLLTMHQP